MKTLTIFTPTYNRGTLLGQLYESLRKQTNQDFKWLIVDDGSKDNTTEIVNEYINNNNLDIEYIRQDNGGKHRAFNTAIDVCKTELIICVDSDDYLVEDAVEKILRRYDDIKFDDNISGIAGLCIDKSNKILGTGYPYDGLISDTIEIRDRYKLPGEPEIYKTKFLKKYNFEEFKEERFITEAILFDKLTSIKKMKYFNDVIMVKEYLEGGLTDNQLKIRIDSILGTKAYYKQRIDLSTRLNGKIRACINYSRFCIHDKDIKNAINTSEKLISCITFPIANAMYLKDRFEINKKYK